MGMLPRSHLCLLIGLLAAAVLVVYGQTLRHDFIDFDDDRYVTANPVVLDGLTRDGLAWAFTTRHEANWHPLTWISHMLDVEVFGKTPWGSHLSALILHLASTLLLFLLLSQMTRLPWRSAFVAAMFAAHPLHVESVAWVAERKDTLSGLFWMMTTLAYVRYAERPSLRHYMPVFVFLALGLMAKPMLVTLPLTLLLLDYWPLRRFSGGPARPGLFLEKIPLFVLAAASSVVTFLAQQKGGSMGTIETYSVGVRAANALAAYVTYLVKTFWPADLAIFYLHPGRTLPVWQVIGSGAALLGLVAMALRLREKRPYLAMGAFWYLITLIPVIGLVQVGSQAMADRYTYIPLIGVFVALAWGVPDLLRRRPVPARPKSRKSARETCASPGSIVRVLAAAVVTAVVVCGHVQARHWKDSLTLFQHAAHVTTRNALAEFVLGGAYEKQGDLEEAIEHYREATLIKPRYVEARNNLGLALVKQGQVDEAIREYNEALKTDGSRAEVHNNLGLALAELGRLDEAISHYTEAIRLKPRFEKPRCNLGTALAEQGRIDEAIQCYRDALRTNQGYADARCRLGLALARQGKVDRAMAEFRKTIEIDPHYAEAYNNLAVAHFMKRNYKQAWRELRRCEELGVTPNPAFVQALSDKLPDPTAR